MVSSLTYRTSDGTRWGAGNGSDVTATQVDLNFWTLFNAVQTLEDNARTLAAIDFVNAVGNLMFIHLTDHRVLGPITLPTAMWNPRGPWQPLTPYAAFDVITKNGAVYLVTVAHTSGSTFSAFSTDGAGHPLYMLLISEPENVIPDGGTVGQRLVRQSGSPLQVGWDSDRIRLACYVEGQPTPNEELMQYLVTDFMTIPHGLVGSMAFSATNTVTNITYGLFKNGASIGGITFNGPSPLDIVVTFTADVLCSPGDIISLVAPAIPDVVQANISFTIVALLTQ